MQIVPKRLTVFRLKPGAVGLLAAIAPDSGIVGYPVPQANRWTLYYEGNLHNAENLKTFEDRVRCAAGRAFQRYPTMAMCSATTEDMQQALEVAGEIGDDYWIDRPGIEVSFEEGTDQDGEFRKWLYGRVTEIRTGIVVRYGNPMQMIPQGRLIGQDHCARRRVAYWAMEDGSFVIQVENP